MLAIYIISCFIKKSGRCSFKRKASILYMLYIIYLHILCNLSFHYVSTPYFNRYIEKKTTKRVQDSTFPDLNQFGKYFSAVSILRSNMEGQSQRLLKLICILFKSYSHLNPHFTNATFDLFLPFPFHFRGSCQELKMQQVQS